MSCIVWRELRGLHEMMAPEKCQNDAIQVATECLGSEVQMFPELSQTEANYTWYFRMFNGNLWHSWG